MSGDADNPAPGGDAGQVLFRAIGVRHGEIWIAAVLAAAGLVFGCQASLLDFGTLALPGPGFIPRVLSLATIAVGGSAGARDELRADSGENVELGHLDVLIGLPAMLSVPLLAAPLRGLVTLCR